MKHLDFKFNATTKDKIFETNSTFSCEIAHYGKSSISAFKKSLEGGGATGHWDIIP